MEENTVRFINTQNGKIEIEFDSDSDIHGYFNAFISFLRASTFSDTVILHGLIVSLYEMVEEAEFNKNETMLNDIKEMLFELEYLKDKK